MDSATSRKFYLELVVVHAILAKQQIRKGNYNLEKSMYTEIYPIYFMAC